MPTTCASPRRRASTPATQFFAYLKDAFDTLYAEGAKSPKMMSIGLHCRLVGRPGRIAASSASSTTCQARQGLGLPAHRHRAPLAPAPSLSTHTVTAMMEQPQHPFGSNLVNLADARLGAEAIFATDDFFAPKERMLNPEPAVFIPGKYDEHGKWMDGWESRRKRDRGSRLVRGEARPAGLHRRLRHRHQPLHRQLPAGGVDRSVLDRSTEARPAATLDGARSSRRPSLKGNAASLRARSTDERAWTHLRLNILPGRRRGAAARLRPGRGRTGRRSIAGEAGRSRRRHQRRPRHRRQRRALRLADATAACPAAASTWATAGRRGGGASPATTGRSSRSARRGTIAQDRGRHRAFQRQLSRPLLDPGGRRLRRHRRVADHADPCSGRTLLPEQKLETDRRTSSRKRWRSSAPSPMCGSTSSPTAASAAMRLWGELI